MTKAHKLVCFLPFLLAGCLTTGTAPSVVKEAVYQPCEVAVPSVPHFPADDLTGDEDIWTKGTVLWADRKARRAYELEVRTALEGCTKK